MNTNSKIRVGIIGGGVGGLTVAQLLEIYELPNVEYTIFERDADDDSRFQGWYLGINDDTIEKLDPIVVNNRQLQILFPDDNDENRLDSIEMLDEKFNTLFKIPGDGFFVNRRLLRKALGAGLRVKWSHKYLNYQIEEDGISASFQQEGSNSIHNYQFDMLIGADGANSLIRAQYAPEITRDDLGFVNIAGMCTFKSTYRCGRPGELTRILGKDGHTILMFSHQEEDKADTPRGLLWVLSFPGTQESWKYQLVHRTDNIDEEYSESPHFREALLDFTLKQASGRFPQEVIDIIGTTTVDTKLWGPRQIYSLNPKQVATLVQKSKTGPNYVVLLGDAAHATTTHRGLGANTAIADAVDLVEAIVKISKDYDANPLIQVADLVDKHIRVYTAKMVKRGVEVMNASLESTASIHATGFEAIKRPYMLRLISFLVNTFAKPVQRKRKGEVYAVKKVQEAPLGIGTGWMVAAAGVTSVAVVVGFALYRRWK